jgi:hypothetical protein
MRLDISFNISTLTTILDHGGYQIRLAFLMPVFFRLAAVDNILELAAIFGGRSHTGSYYFEYFFGMVLQIFKSHHESWKVGLVIVSVPFRPIVDERIIGFCLMLDRHRNRHALDEVVD